MLTRNLEKWSQRAQQKAHDHVGRSAPHDRIAQNVDLVVMGRSIRALFALMPSAWFTNGVAALLMSSSSFACASSSAAIHDPAETTVRANDAESLTALRARGGEFYWQTAEGCEPWQFKLDRIEREVEGTDGRIA